MVLNARLFVVRRCAVPGSVPARRHQNCSMKRRATAPRMFVASLVQEPYTRGAARYAIVSRVMRYARKRPGMRRCCSDAVVRVRYIIVEIDMRRHAYRWMIWCHASDKEVAECVG